MLVQDKTKRGGELVPFWKLKRREEINKTQDTEGAEKSKHDELSWFGPLWPTSSPQSTSELFNPLINNNLGQASLYTGEIHSPLQSALKQRLKLSVF